MLIDPPEEGFFVKRLDSQGIPRFRRKWKMRPCKSRTTDGKGRWPIYPTYPAEPEIFSEAWWQIWQWTVGACRKRNRGMGLSG